MKSKKRLLLMNCLVLVFLIAFQFLTAGSGFSSQNQGDCEALATYVAGLTDEAFDIPITNVTATWKTATGSLPEYCEVRGTIFPETDFAVRLPTDWNGRSIHFGGGAWDGSVGGAHAESLNLGYVGSASNGGHNGSAFSGAFGLKDPYYRQFIAPNDADNPYACQKLVDFGNRAHRETPLVAKEVIKQYYGSYAHHSYFSGGSTGGREGLVVAQLSYDLFDGLFIGYPGGGHVAVTTRGLWNSIQGEVFATNHTVPPSSRDLFTGKAIALHDGVYGKCDGVDGLVDGVIDDPRKCNFDPLTDLPACPDDIDAPGCFTLAQRQALKEIYNGPHNSSGQLYVGTPVSAEHLTNPANPASSGFGAALLDGLMGDLFRYIVFDPPPGPNWDMMTFDWETDFYTIKESTCTQCYDDECVTYSIAAELDAITLSYPIAPNMGGFGPLKQKGGKIMQWHGWSDALVSAFTSVSLYETAMSQMGLGQTKDFWKLYMVPGAGHGGGGYGGPPSWVDIFEALVNWVENGVEPGHLIGTRSANAAWGWPERTRPLCPYPEVARYSGEGSIDDAENFACVNIISANVRIEPKTINLESKGVFTAFFTLPKQHQKRYRHRNDCLDVTVVCEGAQAVKADVIKRGHGYVAKFRTQDLMNITPGDKVTFTAYAIFDHYGETFAFEGSDKVRVIEKEVKPPKQCKNKK